MLHVLQCLSALWLLSPPQCPSAGASGQLFLKQPFLSAQTRLGPYCCFFQFQGSEQASITSHSGSSHSLISPSQAKLLLLPDLDSTPVILFLRRNTQLHFLFRFPSLQQQQGLKTKVQPCFYQSWALLWALTAVCTSTKPAIGHRQSRHHRTSGALPTDCPPHPHGMTLVGIPGCRRMSDANGNPGPFLVPFPLYHRKGGRRLSHHQATGFPETCSNICFSQQLTLLTQIWLQGLRAINMTMQILGFPKGG